MDERLRQRLNRKLSETSLSKVVDIPEKNEMVNDELIDDYVFLQEEPRFSTLEAIITDPSKLALILLFGVSMYALYVLNKKS